MIMSDEWLRLSQVAKVMGVHPGTVRVWADLGRLPVHRTQGGHRRFLRSEVELSLASQRTDKPFETDQAVQNALRRMRVQIVEGHLETQGWYRKLDEEAREQYRRGGRDLLQGMMLYLSSSEEEGKAEARAIGYEYASLGRRSNLSSAEIARAFMFFRNTLFDSMLAVYESASIRSARAWGDMLKKVNQFTDEIMLTLIETYAAFQKSNR